MEVESDLSEIKALASSTRIEILKKLSERNHTVSELSRILNLSKPTVLHHMRVLEAAGLIRRVDDERKWVYYQLTEKGRVVIRLRRIKLLLSILILALPVALLTSLLMSMRVKELPKAAGDRAVSALGSSEPLFWMILLISLLLVLLAYFIVERRLKHF